MSKEAYILKPTTYLLECELDQLSQVEVYQLTKKGFDLDKVQSMLATSALYSQKKIIQRIVGKSLRAIQSQHKKQPVRLSAQQSTVAFLYAKLLELAIDVFGSQQLAEAWLARPCKQLDGSAPLEIVDNWLGFRLVEDYLHRIHYGVYQ